MIVLLITAVIGLVALILIGVMLGRRDPDLSAAVRHLFVEVDSERAPVLPDHYPTRAPSVLLVVGDEWAAGAGADNPAVNSWWALLRAHPRLQPLSVMRVTNTTAQASNIVELTNEVVLPRSMQGARVAIVVQCGWNDLINAQTNGSLDELDLHAMADHVVESASTLAQRIRLQKAASTAVYILDYPDASAGTGFTGMSCEAPLNRIYNRAAPVDVHLRALDMYSQALLGAANNHNFVFVPLRATLSAVGTAEAMHSVARLDHRAVDVTGAKLASVPGPPAFDLYCGLMNAIGQGYQAALVAAHLLNEAYFIVG